MVWNSSHSATYSAAIRENEDPNPREKLHRLHISPKRAEKPFGIDSDMVMILLLILVLQNEKCDEKLIIALFMIMML